MDPVLEACSKVMVCVPEYSYELNVQWVLKVYVFTKGFLLVDGPL